MLPDKKKHPLIKAELHPQNKHRERYDFMKLIDAYPALKQFVGLNKYEDASIDFFNPEAVKALNKALLYTYYDLKYWDIPKGYLCPPIPGRADYIHHIADLLAEKNNGIIPRGDHIVALDIGVGANCIYPIIGNKEYGWSFLGTDIDRGSFESAMDIVEENPQLIGKIELMLQEFPKDIFHGVIQENEWFDFTICNPPFHSSPAEAAAGTFRKMKNLKGKKVANKDLNFGGKNNELWCEGGEARFIKDMIFESRHFSNSCFWFSTLVSKESNLRTIYAVLKKVEAFEVKTIAMGQGNKKSRIVAWTFLDKAQQQKWKERKWNKK